MKNVVIVRRGGSGAVLGRKIAEESDIPVRIIERWPQIAGNMYDEQDEHGFLIQKYGPHHFYTNNVESIREKLQAVTIVGGVISPFWLPFNIYSIFSLYTLFELIFSVYNNVSEGI